jgi:hypothetical protein
MEVWHVRGSKNTGLMVSGVIAIVFLLAAGGVILYALAQGTPGTWTSASQPATRGWPIPSCGVMANAEARYNFYGNAFDYANHYVSRFAVTPPIYVEPWMVMSYSYRKPNGQIILNSMETHNPNQWGIGKFYPGEFTAVGTKGFSEFKDSFGIIFSLTTKWATVYP